jgi:hypothetical protein
VRGVLAPIGFRFARKLLSARFEKKFQKIWTFFEKLFTISF